MVSACLAWPSLHIAFVEAGKQSQISFDSWHTVFLDSVYLHMHAPLKGLYEASSQWGGGQQAYTLLSLADPSPATEARTRLCLCPGRTHLEVNENGFIANWVHW